MLCFLHVQMMMEGKPHNLTNPAQALPDAMRRAVTAAGVEPISSMENMSSELSTDTELQEAFSSQVSSTLARRLQNDSDFKSDRFPHSSEYYHKSAGKKWNRNWRLFERI